MQIRGVRPPGFFWINWWLMNHCNYKCSYCADLIKNGSVELIDIDHAKDFVDQCAKYSIKKNLRINLDITGGEVTQWYFLDDLLRHAKSYNSYNKIRTNASQNLKEFADTIDLLDSIQLDFHPEYASVSHFFLCVKESIIQGKEVFVNVNMMPERWQETSDLYEDLKSKWPNLNITKRMLFEDPAINKVPLEYTEEAIVELKDQKGDIELDHGDRIEYTDYQTLILDQRNNFKGANCRIGIEQIIVDAWGVVRRGHCRQGSSIGKLGDIIRFDDREIICQKPDCSNAFDIMATKTLDRSV
jgi:MoaA/NifB/PqqE/SkfB family radical SAM enzyme